MPPPLLRRFGILLTHMSVIDQSTPATCTSTTWPRGTWSLCRSTAARRSWPSWPLPCYGSCLCGLTRNLTRASTSRAPLTLYPVRPPSTGSASGSRPPAPGSAWSRGDWTVCGFSPGEVVVLCGPACSRMTKKGIRGRSAPSLGLSLGLLAKCQLHYLGIDKSK